MIGFFPKLYRNTLFRLTLLAAGLSVICTFISLGYVYYATVITELRAVDNELVSEMTELETLYREKGPVAVNREVVLRFSSRSGLYLLRHRDLYAGNLAGNPALETEPPKGLLALRSTGGYTRRELIYSPDTGDGLPPIDRRVRGISGPLKTDGQTTGFMLVARDVEVTMRNAERVKSAILTSSLIALILGLLSGVFVSRRFSQRVEALNRLADDIRAGHLTHRAPRNYSEDELDLLAEHLNAMLDHIDRLMKAMRYAGDSIAHDLRSPLTRLRTRLESAATDMNDPQSQGVLFSAADDASELLRTFDSVLRIARLEAGERRELLVDIDPKLILDDIAELYEPLCEEAHIAFSANISSGLSILADRGLLSQAVSNLVENAIKYTPAGGRIEVSLAKNKIGRVELSVSDDGPGIPLEDRQRVKERFVRLEKSRTQPGSGLGLTMVDAIADLHRAEFVIGDGFAGPNEGFGLKASIVFPRRRPKKNTGNN